MVQARSIAGATFSPDGRAFVTTTSDGSTRRWPVPAPVEDELDQLVQRVQVHTAMAMGDGQSVVPLDPRRWQECRTKLGNAPAASITAAVLHDARARDAEADDDAFAARWHLDRLIAAAPDWQAYARRAHTWTTQGRFDQAEADYARALERGAPDRLLGWYRHRSMECRVRKNPAAARWYLDRAIALAPDDWQLYADRADVLDDPAERAADRARAVERGADSYFMARLAEEHAGRGAWDQAATAYAQAEQRGRCLATTWHKHALVLLKLGDRAGYTQLCTKTFDAEKQTPYPDLANNLAWVCALGPDAVTDYPPLVHLAERVVSGVRPHGKVGALNTLGAVLYRAGRFQDAIDRLNEGIKLSKGAATAYDWLFMAMAHQRLGATAQAREYLAKVAPGPPPPALSWDRLEIELLHREAQELIEGK